MTKAVGGYGYSGWVWETLEGHFQTKQGPKLIHLETSIPRSPDLIKAGPANQIEIGAASPALQVMPGLMRPKRG